MKNNKYRSLPILLFGAPGCCGCPEKEEKNPWAAFWNAGPICWVKLGLAFCAASGGPGYGGGDIVGWAPNVGCVIAGVLGYDGCPA